MTINLSSIQKKLPPLLLSLKEDKIQSTVFELCNNETQLVQYHFTPELIPIFHITKQGNMIPHISDHKTAERIKLTCDNNSAVEEFWAKAADISQDEIFEFDGADQLQRIIDEYRDSALTVNNEYRRLTGRPNIYLHGCFAVEGKILYLLNNKGEAARECVYKVKPDDTYVLHNVNFDTPAYAHVVSTIAKIQKRDLELTKEVLQQELDLHDESWKQYNKEIMKLAIGRPNIYANDYIASKQKMLILVGLPGSGKSTFANKLCELSSWTRVNQDEMKTRKKCERNAVNGFEEGGNIIVDRCNFDIMQRTVWIQLATKYGCNDIRCVYLDISADVCKKRVSVRKDHPTIKPGKHGFGIIDRFKNMLFPPVEGEGFSHIITVSNDEEIEVALEQLAKIE